MAQVWAHSEDSFSTLTHIHPMKLVIKNGENETQKKSRCSKRMKSQKRKTGEMLYAHASKQENN
jgi:hypothetical protein